MATERARALIRRWTGRDRARPPEPAPPEPAPPGSSRAPLLVAGHRGTCVNAPENTMAAFRYAAAAGAYAVELDVQWSLATPDEPSRMVVIHDWVLDRTTDGTGPVTEQPWSVLSRLDAGAWFGEAWRGERLPLFADALAYVAGTSMRLNAELKVKSVTPEQAAAYVAAVRAAGMEERTMASSFYTAVLRAVQTASEGRIATGIVEQANPRSTQNVVDRGSGYFPVHWVLTPEAVAELQAGSVQIFTWPATEDAELEAAYALGVDGVTADDPAAALAWVARRADSPGARP